jgi:hypothetical protein
MIPAEYVVVTCPMKGDTTAIYYLFMENKIFAVNKAKKVNFFLKEFDEMSLQY